MTARKMKSLQPGERLEIIGDDPGIVEDMPVWCEETGHRLLSLDREDAEVRCIVEKAANPASPRHLDSTRGHC